MRVIVAGTRTAPEDADLVTRAISGLGIVVTEVVCGGAPGADTAGQLWAEFRGIPVKKFEPAWDIHGRAAGPIRNRAMAEYADFLVALWDGKSPGTANMIAEATRQGLHVFVYPLPEDDR